MRCRGVQIPNGRVVKCCAICVASVGAASASPLWMSRDIDKRALCTHLRVFGQDRDHAVAYNMYRERMLRGSAAGRAHFFVVGTHDGRDMEPVVSAPWWNVSNGVVHGWEILDSNYARAEARLASHIRLGDVELSHRDVSSQRGSMRRKSVGHSGEGGFLDPDPLGQTQGLSKVHSFSPIEVVAWADVLRELSIAEVSYSLVDTEGHEPLVLRGMALRQSANAFPAFQFEVATTWCDGRRVGAHTQHDVALNLEGFGYVLFLMGDLRGDSVHLGMDVADSAALLPVNASAFATARCPDNKGFQAQAAICPQGSPFSSNVLAILKSQLAAHRSLRTTVETMVAAWRSLPNTATQQ